ncbi:hypothetical protein ACFU7Y_05820 [Kitasatospora sp. NPDC057542]|nr:hypothetical protein [Streptomyces sp. LS1784]
MVVSLFMMSFLVGLMARVGGRSSGLASRAALGPLANGERPK